MKSLLLFLAGVLVGANLVYFFGHRHAYAQATEPVAAASPAPAATTTAGVVPPTPAPPSPSPAVAPAPAPAPAATAVVAAAAVASTQPSPAGLLLPVAGIKPSQLTDTFTDARSGGRQHEALDIMAARSTPVLAASDGTVAKLFTSVRGGLTIYEFDPTRTWAYYYAHLDHYAAGLAEGNTLKRGEVIGYVGSTGDASPDAPHLHFAIFVLGPEKQWWKGTAIDPYPLLAKPQ